MQHWTSIPCFLSAFGLKTVVVWFHFDVVIQARRYLFVCSVERWDVEVCEGNEMSDTLFLVLDEIF